MRFEIFLNVSAQETRVALLEDGILQEIVVEREAKRGKIGNIYMGKVMRVLPGMQAAFIDIGLPKAAFLHVKDSVQTHEDQPLPSISDLLVEGQTCLVQIIKDEFGQKGARLSMRLAIASRYLVYMPSLDHIGVSSRLEDPQERARLVSLVQKPIDGGEESHQGYIIRTAAEGLSEQGIIGEKKYLHHLWAHIEKKARQAQPGTLIHQDDPLFLRVMRDFVVSDVHRICVDEKQAWTQMRAFAERFMPEVTSSIELFNSPFPIFDVYRIEEEIQKALERKVGLKSGGSIVFDSTEAMTTVDVNTGSFVGQMDVEQTIFKTNLEAAKAIARQLRLRNIGGIILIDFIDMGVDEHKEQVMRVLKDALAHDHVKTTVSPLSPLGLVEMTRKRSRESLAQALCQPCRMCQGAGIVKSVDTLCFEIARELTRVAQAFSAMPGFWVITSPMVMESLVGQHADLLMHLQDALHKRIEVRADAHYADDAYEIVPQQI